jgi:hypothetical protein
MSDHPYRLTDDQVADLLRARTADPDLSLLDEILRSAAATPQTRPFLERPAWLSSPKVIVAIIGLLVALAASIAVGARLIAPEPDPLNRLPVARELVGAINARDADAVRSLLASDATVVLMQIQSDGERESPDSDWSVTVPDFVGAWLGAADAWGLEAEVVSCRAASASVVECEMVARWHTIQVEGLELWTFGFDGPEVVRLETARLDREPETRTLPLSHRDLQSWDAWLSETHPTEAGRLAGDQLFWNFYFRYHLSEADFVHRLIGEYLESR